MNQAILFNDDAAVDQETGHVVFSAMYLGQMIPCRVLYQSENALSHFALHQFDYEEAAEAAINDDAFNAQGEVELPPMA